MQMQFPILYFYTFWCSAARSTFRGGLFVTVEVDLDKVDQLKNADLLSHLISAIVLPKLFENTWADHIKHNPLYLGIVHFYLYQGKFQAV